jgi:hypothetical protein
MLSDMATFLLVSLLNGGLFDHGVSVHAQSGSDRVIVRSRVVSIETRAHHAELFVAALTGDGDGVLMADAPRAQPIIHAGLDCATESQAAP